ncbi:MAG TPA: hypothetical protein VH352_24620 [Pseudonocardiaceae bacterium]|nr:hypothetical protein [Pseudonocardiaceae bacterium]
MSQPHEPTPDADPTGGATHSSAPGGGADQAGATPGPTEPLPPVAGAQPPTESEPAPSAASAAEPPPSRTDVPPPPHHPDAPPMSGPAGHYVFVPAGATIRTRRFGPAFGRFARNRATQLVAAVVVGAVVGGGTVAIVDNATYHDQHARPFRTGQSVIPFGDGFGNGNGRPGFVAPGPNQGFGQGGTGPGG